MKPTLNQIFYGRVRIAKPEWDPDIWIRWNPNTEMFSCSHGPSRFVNAIRFIAKDYSLYDWQVWKGPKVKPKPCPVCGAAPTAYGDNSAFWVACNNNDNNCYLRGPVRETKAKAIAIWNALQFDPLMVEGVSE